MVCFKLSNNFYTDGFYADNTKELFDRYSSKYYSSGEHVFRRYDIKLEDFFKLVISGKWAIFPISKAQNIRQLQNYYNFLGIKSILVYAKDYKTSFVNV